VFDAEQGNNIQATGLLFLNLATGTGTNPWGGTLAFQGVNQVAVGEVGGEYILCNNAGDTINSGFGSSHYGGNTLIVGGGGNDSLNGSNVSTPGVAVVNVLVAGSGTAILSGGVDNWNETPVVTNIFSYNLGVDTITNFVTGNNSGDIVDVSAVPGLSSFADVQKLMSQVGANTVINFGNGATITLDNVTESALTASNFLFAPEAAFAFTQPGEVDTGGTAKIYLAMTGAVTVNTASGSPTLILSDGAIATYDAVASSAAGHVLVFDYTVGAGGHSPDLAIESFVGGAAVITDANGHNVDFSHIASQQLGLQINPTPFYLTSVTPTPGSGTEVDTGGTVTITLSMSESNFTIDPSHLPYLALSDGETAYYTGSSGNQITFSYTVSSTDHSPDLAIVAVEQGPIDGPSPASLTDSAGYVADLSKATNASLGVRIGPTLYVSSIDTDAALNPDTGGLEANAGSTVHLTLNMNEAVTVTGAPILELSDGASASYDAGLSAPGSGTLVFDYLVGAKDSTSNLLANSISGGSIVDANNVSADFTNINLLATGLQINPSPLTVTHLSESATGQVSVGQTVTLTLQMSEAVTVKSPFSLTLDLNDGEQAFYDNTNSNPSAGILKFNYIVGADNPDPHTLNLEITGLSLSVASSQNIGSIQDSNGNNAYISAALNVPTDIQVGPPLFVNSIGTTWTGTEAVAGQTVQLDVNMSEGVTIDTSNGSPTLTLSDGATATYDAAASNLSAGKVVFDYKVGASDSTPFLDVSSINPNGAVITDASHNAADLTLTEQPTPILVPTQYGTATLQIGPATVDSVEASQLGSVQAGQKILIEINTDDFLTVDTTNGTPTLTLNNGATAAYDATLTDPSLYPSLVFDYTVGANDSVANLEIASVNPNGATFTDPAGYAVNFAGALDQPLNIQVGGSGSGSTPLDDIYQAVLQRAPTNTEGTAATALQATVGVAGEIAAIVDSPEAQYNVYPIVQIIELATGGFPTAAQLSGWVPFVETNGLLQGPSQTNPLLDQMAEAFVASTEFGNTYNGGTAVDPNAPITASIVSAIIHAATGIAAVQSQIDAWVSTGQTIDQVFVDFALGDQYSAHLQNAVQQYLTTTADTAAGGSGLGVVNGSTPNDGLTTTQVTGAYQAVLQRAPSSGETNAALSIDSSIGNVAALEAVVDSPEAQQYVYPVTQIILLATGNLPTPVQLGGWVPAVKSGTSLDDMALAFVASSEFGNTYNGGTAVDPNAPITAAIVSAIIHAATGIAATQTQITTWVGTALTIDQVFVDFSLGDQYTAAIQSTVQDYLTAAAINGAGLTTVDGVNATGALTLGTAAAPLTGSDLTMQGGSGTLTVVATGKGDTITELNTSTAGGTITANGSGDTIDAANGANTITANGSVDTITLGVVSTGTTITAAQTIHAQGAGDIITFATHAADGPAVTWAASSTIDGGTSSTGIGANSTVNFGNNVASGSETVVLTGDLTGATTLGGTSTTGIAMTMLGNVVHASGDQIVFDNATTEVLAGTSAVNVSSAASLAHAFDMAAAAAAASQSADKIAANTGVIDWFQYNNNTYLVESINNTGSSATHSALAATDEVIKIVGLVSLSGESLATHTLTL
jgi:phage tail protein X